MTTTFILLGAVVIGWIGQGYTTYRQAKAFNAEVLRLRRSGTVSVGVAGRRYRGGRAYVAIAVDPHGIVREAISLSGWTTFARAQPAPGLVGAKATQVRGDRALPTLTRQQREAARQAATLLLEEGRPRLIDAAA